MLDGAFALIAAQFSTVFGGPYHTATARWPGAPILDDGGSIASTGIPVQTDCLCQVDAVTEALRSEAGYRDKDVALILLALDALDTDATVEVTAGPSQGRYSVQSVSRDAAGSHWVARGRPA